MSNRKAFMAALLAASATIGSCQNHTTNTTCPYKGATLCVEARIEDLLSRMTLEENAGQLFQNSLTVGPNGTLAPGTSTSNSTENAIGDKLMTHFNLRGDVDDVRLKAQWYNRIQQRALDTRLGIPITLSSDPRHASTKNIGMGFAANAFSQWPESLGLAALHSPELVQKFADVAREEYLAIGLRGALHPQIDLSTEYRWARI